MTDTWHRELQRELGSSYQLGHELAGGMSRVFVADEVALGRKVVVKVLPPDMAAGVSQERFRREIQLAARLQHPHIVPLLAAGALGDVLYYVMPLVEGESLRARLAREGELPVADALHIIRDVADALAYAHEQGIVHRDIKPDNILLSRGHALVTDFGVAKALTASATSETLTSLGIALGTPAYMAPEQAAADTHVDQRADLYSLGVVGYEMLIGRPPFVGTNAAGLLRAHVTQTPDNLATHRASVPPAVSTLVMRCLEKRAADRWQTAGELVAQLDAVVTPGAGTVVGPSPRANARRTLAIASLIVVVVFGAAWMLTQRLGIGPFATLASAGVLTARDPIVLADFANRTSDSMLASSITEAFRIDLEQSPFVKLVDRSTVGDVLARMRRDSSTAVTEPVAREVAERYGAKAIVAGEVAPLAGGYVLTLRLLSATDGSVLKSGREIAASGSALLLAIERLSRTLRGDIGESMRSMRGQPGLERVTTSSLPALRAYTAGYRAANAGDLRHAITLLEQAVALDSNFGMAWRKLASTYLNIGSDADRVRATATRAYELRGRMPPREALHAEAFYHFIVTYDWSKVIETYERLVASWPDDGDATANLGRAYEWARRWADADRTFRRGWAIKSDSGALWANMIEVLFAEGRLDAVDSILKVTARHARNHALRLRNTSLLERQRGHFDRAFVYADSAFRLDSNPAIRISLYKYLGREREAIRLLRQSAEASERRREVPVYLNSILEIAEVQAFTLGQPNVAIREVESALQRHPLESIPPTNRPYGRLAALFILSGQPARARALMAEYERVVPAEVRRVNFREQWARALISLDAKDPRSTIKAVDSAIALTRACEQCLLLWKAQAYERLARPDSALAVYEHIANGTEIGPDSRELFLPAALRRLGELYENKHDATSALKYYGRFVDLWKHADPELQPVVKDVRRRMADLAGEPRP
jgi:eukaryotic-like serine/threonine-protein kinase